MTAAFVFIGFWALVAITLFFIAVRGGPRGARAALQTQSRRGRKGSTIVFVVLYLGLGIAVPAVLLIGDHDNANAQVRGTKLSASARHGRELFGAVCASCHTLSAADADGQVGPNLDMLRPSKDLVLDALAHGRQRGNGTMPAGLYQGKDARDVADFVAQATKLPTGQP